ncbi:hypothetical protein G1H11_05605 [Phytoactinopolyspora alkaliphila]|uniref:Uncharacterized protein n=2 Tax=Phytoactinopolyspora alkaliphila TaxID=1783498 RepID=A0A6N9YIG0_9ACTN|nr:hypothetical protein [Phytoactinopolyspora alkaliphila]
MWRKRPRARGIYAPFPDPIEVVDGVDRFDRDEVVRWLEKSGRGNNPEAGLDAPALSPPDGVQFEDLVTLLCLAAASGEELAETSMEDRQTLARGADPRDEFILREVITMESTADTLRFIDDLLEAAFGPGEALARLEQGRAGRALGTRDLTSGALELIRTFTEACALHLDPNGVPLIHAGHAVTLTLALADDFAPLVVRGDGTEQRALRRRASIRGIDTTDSQPSPNIRMLSVLGSRPADALDAIDNVVIELDKDELAIVLGPASLLCDELRGDQDKDRAQTLRSGNLVVAVRLPRGMWREAHRQALGLWVCAGGKSIDQPLIADLAAFTGDEYDAGDLAADLTGALEAQGARAFRYLRRHDLALILSSRTPVVPRGVRAVQLATTDVERYLDKINTETLVTSEPIPTFDVLAEAAPGTMLLRRRSVGELKDLGFAHVKRGSRIDPSHAHDNGSVAVLSAAGANKIKLDPFDAAHSYPRAARTEPGDVIFTERPRPCALVDNHGGSLVASPSKILRIGKKAGIGPHTVSAIINRLPDDATDWQTWSVPVLDATATGQLEQALIAAYEYESTLRANLDAAHRVIGAMIDGVAAGAVTLTTPRED